MAAALCAWLLGGPASAAQARHVEVPAGDLAEGLESLARQLRVNLIYPSGQLRGLRTHGVQGAWDVQAAFDRLLEGTALKARLTAGSVLVSAGSAADANGSTAAPVTPAARAGGEAAAGAVAGGAALPADILLDEVVVTGTYIRRDETFMLASPVRRIGRDELQSHAPASLAGFTATLPLNGASVFSVGRGVGSTNGTGTVNLRSLGADATLVLVNSRRVAREPVSLGSVDVNALLPQIAIGRIDLLKDGASALYGSDAVAGVVNFITRQGFEGLEVSAERAIREIGGTTDDRLGAIWGMRNARTSVMLAAEFQQRERFNYETLQVIAAREGSIDGEYRQTGWPIRVAVPNRDGAGLLAGPATTLADPLCAAFTGSSTPIGTVERLGETYAQECLQNVAMGTSVNADQRHTLLYAEMQHELHAGLRLFGEVGLLRNRVALADTPGGSVRPAPGQPPVVIPGYAPGNPFRASNAAGVPLFAVPGGMQLDFDKDGDGVREFVPARDASGVVLLNAGADGMVGTADDAQGGVPFWEDVTIQPGSRIFGLNCNLPGDPASRRNCRNQINMTRAAVDNLRWAAGLEGRLARDWRYRAAATWSVNNEAQTALGSTFSMPALRAALAGYGGAGCRVSSADPLQSGRVPGSAGCSFFNIFGNSVTAQPGSPAANTVETGLFVSALDWSRFEATLRVIEAVLEGRAGHTPAGPVRLALGAQQRRESWSADFSALKNSGDDDLQAPSFDKDVNQSGLALFAETSVPLLADTRLGTLEFNGALRHEQLRGPGFSTTDPKLGLLYESPARHWQLRGTWGTSFLAPTLYQRFRQNMNFTNGVDDYYTPENDNLSRVPSDLRGNARLKPQQSENFNIGFTWRPGLGTTVELDYWDFRFRDQISLENGQVLAMDPVAALDGSRVRRDLAAGTVMHEGVNIGQIVGLDLTYVNVARISTAGVDVGVSHRSLLGAAGALVNSLQLTWQARYSVNGVDGTGSRNALLAGASPGIPVRALLRSDWSRGPHLLQSQLRYTEGFRNDAYPNAGGSTKARVEPYWLWDLSYTRRLGSARAWLDGLRASVGVRNVLDAAAPWVPDVNHILPTLYDYSGRGYWLRLAATL